LVTTQVDFIVKFNHEVLKVYFTKSHKVFFDSFLDKERVKNKL